MADLWDVVTPSDLTRFSRRLITESPLQQQMILNQLLPDVINRSNKVRVRELTRTLTAARFRVWNAANYIGKRPFTLSITELELPPLGQKIEITESDVLRRAIETPQDPEVLAIIYDDTTTNVRATLARMELARGDLLTDGVVTIDENGIRGLEADFDLDDSHLPTADIDWSDPDALILDEEEAWIQQMVDDGSPGAEKAVASRRIVNFMRKNSQVKASLNNNANASVPDLSVAQLNDVRVNHDLPPITIYDTKIDVDGSLVRPIPDTKFIILGPDAGETQWGLTAQALEAASGNSDPAFTRADAPGIFTGAYKDSGESVSRFTSTHAVGLPVLFNKARLLSAEVLDV